MPPDLTPKAKANVSMVIETMYAIAAEPDKWEQIVQALDVEASDAPPEAEGAARLAVLAGDRGEAAQVGVVLINAAGGASAWNAAGEAVFHQRLGVIEAQGLRFFNPANHEALDQARHRLRGTQGRQVIVKFSQADDEAPHFAYVVPASGLPAALAAGVGGAVTLGEGACAVVFPAVEATDRLWANLRESFGLTPAETRLAARLKDGLTLKEAAVELNVSFNTVRNQLRAIFEKVGLSRQSELIRTLTQLGSLATSFQESSGRGLLGPPIAATERGAVETSPPIRFLALPDGRRLAWRAYGDPKGKAVLVVHQGLGCSIMPRGTDALARDLGLRLLCPERPGAGRSDISPDYSYEAVGRDFADLCRDQGLAEVQVAAFMSGAPFALMAARELGPIASRVLLASARPSGQTLETERDKGHAVVLFRRRILRNAWLADMVFAMMRLQLTRKQLEKFVRAAASAPGDAAYLRTHPGVLEFIVDYISESLALTSRGIADEIKCSARSPTLDLSRLSAPITVWHGEQDPMNTAADVTAWLNDRQESLRIFPDAGHFLPHKHWPEVLAWLAA
ncbi:alpha/beta fold hydrolase [Phenylobacterium ferrooxidans]|uniref:Alpha/beta fold hydrolase n=1 Tax=Phenylobacterium ferrooxidans TaxID=2982689 RepID=A0ABW6CKX3_9CAUL